VSQAARAVFAVFFDRLRGIVIYRVKSGIKDVESHIEGRFFRPSICTVDEAQLWRREKELKVRWARRVPSFSWRLQSRSFQSALTPFNLLKPKLVQD
jgi:hypothetical protein